MPFNTAENSREISLAVVNARIWTGDVRKPWADALAVRGESLAAVGGSAEIRKLCTPSTRVIDAKKQFVVPGFIDSHVHFLPGGFALQSVELRDAKTKEEFVRRIAEFAKTVAPGVWIRNGDWDHELWGGELPTREWIDSVTPNNPVWINRLDGHMALANSRALEHANVSRHTPDVDGGTIVRDASGEPTGMLKDNAMPLVSDAIPERTFAEWDGALNAAMQYVAQHGVTSVHNMGTWQELAVFRRAHAAGKLRTRIYAAVPLSSWSELREDVVGRGRGDNWLRTGALKGFVDGSLGSHTAAMLEPFTDAPDDTGLFVNTLEDLYNWTKQADDNGLHVIVHAIGDRAIRTQLDIYERIIRDNGPRDRRFRIEHAQHVAPADMHRFGELGVICSMQPYHAIDDGRWAEKVIGHERAKSTYAFRSLLDNKATLAFGSDWFVAPPIPIGGIYAAVTRATIDDKQPDGWIPEQKITVEEALRAYTMGAAVSGFQEGNTGSLSVGKLADFVIIDQDLTTMAPREIRDATVQLTAIGGSVVFEKNLAS